MEERKCKRKEGEYDNSADVTIPNGELKNIGILWECKEK